MERSQSLDLEENVVTTANSQIMKLGQKAIQRSISASQNDNVTIQENKTNGTIQEKKTITAKLLSTSLLVSVLSSTKFDPFPFLFLF